jgi:hypothetical protein
MAPGVHPFRLELQEKMTYGTKWFHAFENVFVASIGTPLNGGGAIRFARGSPQLGWNF